MKKNQWPEQTTQSIIIKGDIRRIYDLWADFEQFPKFMQPIKSVEKLDEFTSHWIAEGPLGKNIEWDAITTRMEQDRRIA